MARSGIPYVDSENRKLKDSDPAMLSQTGMLLILSNAALHLPNGWLNFTGIRNLERPILPLHEGRKSSGAVKSYVNWFRSSRAQIRTALAELEKQNFIEEDKECTGGQRYRITPQGETEITSRLATLPLLEEEQKGTYRVLKEDTTASGVRK